MDTLSRMRAFVEIVDAGGYSAAARKIGRSKALLSKYVRELEDDLGTLLINRTTRQFSLTEAGMLYLASAQELLDKLNEMEDRVRESGRELKGRLRIAAPKSLSGVGLGTPISEFAKLNPDIVLDIQLDDRVVDLVEERFDVAFRIGRLEDSSLIAKRLSDFCLVYCASPKFLKKTGDIKHPMDLAKLPAIVDTNWRGKNNWPFVEKDGSEFTQHMNSILEVNDPTLCKRAALLDLGVTMVPSFSVVKELQEGTLISVLADYAQTGAGYYMVYANRRHVPAKVREFVDFMAEWFRKNKLA